MTVVTSSKLQERGYLQWSLKRPHSPLCLGVSGCMVPSGHQGAEALRRGRYLRLGEQGPAASRGRPQRRRAAGRGQGRKRDSPW